GASGALPTRLDAFGFFAIRFLAVRFLAPFVAFAFVRVEQFLAQPYRFGRHFDELVIVDIGERLFQRHADRRREPDGFILGVRADFGELLPLEPVALRVVARRVLATDHAAVTLPARLNHHRAAIFQVPHGVSDRLALVGRDQYAIAAACDLAAMRPVSMKQPIYYRSATRIGEQFTMIAVQPARRRVENQPHASAAGRPHLDHLALTLGEFLHDNAGMHFVDVDENFLDRFEEFAGRPALKQDFGTRYR